MKMKNMKCILSPTTPIQKGKMGSFIEKSLQLRTGNP